MLPITMGAGGEGTFAPTPIYFEKQKICVKITHEFSRQNLERNVKTALKHGNFLPLPPLELVLPP